jgi:hypothetical protein
MKKLLLVPTMLLGACATTGGGGGSKGSTAPFQGLDVVQKRRNEIIDAGKVATDCLKVKPEEKTAFKGGMFSVTAEASGKLSVEPIRWEGPDTAKQCIVAAAAKTTVTPLPGPSVSATWEWNAPGEKPKTPTPPGDLENRVSSLQMNAGTEVDACAQQNLPPDFPAEIDVAFLVDPSGKVYGPTVIKSTSKDGGFDSCVQNVVGKSKFPQENVEAPYPVTFHFRVGRLEKL